MIDQLKTYRVIKSLSEKNTDLIQYEGFWSDVSMRDPITNTGRGLNLLHMNFSYEEAGLIDLKTFEIITDCHLHTRDGKDELWVEFRDGREEKLTDPNVNETTRAQPKYIIFKK